jgi:poly(A) polymerase
VVSYRIELSVKDRVIEDQKIIKLLKGFLKNFSKNQSATEKSLELVIIPRSEHKISRSMISPNALKVLYRLNTAGFTAFLVGGCVRDLLLDRQPKDFDIATNALPEEVRKLFRNCRLIGKRFRLAHIVFGKEIIEVATFRTHHKQGEEKHGHMEHGMIVRDNVYGTIEDDAWRRDFTINALYYNIADFSIMDYTGGIVDLSTMTLRMIGDPVLRFNEDPVRLLRAIRFVGKLNLNISPETETQIRALSHLLGHVSPARLFQEVLKFFQEGATLPTFKLLQKYDLFTQLFPQTAAVLAQQPGSEKLLEAALADTDERSKAGKHVSPAFLFAVFLWHPVYVAVKNAMDEGLPTHVSYEKALKQVLRQQTESLTIPRRLIMSVQEICFLQHRLTCRYGHAPHRLLDHPRFRAAYDLLHLRSASGEEVQELSKWWIQFHDADVEQRDALIKEVSRTAQPRKKRKFHKARQKKKIQQKTQV